MLQSKIPSFPALPYGLMTCVSICIRKNTVKAGEKISGSWFKSLVFYVRIFIALHVFKKLPYSFLMDDSNFRIIEIMNTGRMEILQKRNS
jgi:hypothetical protein